eukprot:SAG31_NODE_82_length_27046_cov_45.857275_4_plen_790_part_00
MSSVPDGIDTEASVDAVCVPPPLSPSIPPPLRVKGPPPICANQRLEEQAAKKTPSQELGTSDQRTEEIIANAEKAMAQAVVNLLADDDQEGSLLLESESESESESEPDALPIDYCEMAAAEEEQTPPATATAAAAGAWKNVGPDEFLPGSFISEASIEDHPVRRRRRRRRRLRDSTQVPQQHFNRLTSSQGTGHNGWGRARPPTQASRSDLSSTARWRWQDLRYSCARGSSGAQRLGAVEFALELVARLHHQLLMHRSPGLSENDHQNSEFLLRKKIKRVPAATSWQQRRAEQYERLGCWGHAALHWAAASLTLPQEQKSRTLRQHYLSHHFRSTPEIVSTASTNSLGHCVSPGRPTLQSDIHGLVLAGLPEQVVDTVQAAKESVAWIQKLLSPMECKAKVADVSSTVEVMAAGECEAHFYRSLQYFEKQQSRLADQRWLPWAVNYALSIDFRLNFEKDAIVIGIENNQEEVAQNQENLSKEKIASPLKLNPNNDEANTLGSATNANDESAVAGAKVQKKQRNRDKMDGRDKEFEEIQANFSSEISKSVQLKKVQAKGYGKLNRRGVDAEGQNVDVKIQTAAIAEGASNSIALGADEELQLASGCRGLKKTRRSRDDGGPRKSKPLHKVDFAAMAAESIAHSRMRHLSRHPTSVNVSKRGLRLGAEMHMQQIAAATFRPVRRCATQCWFACRSNCGRKSVARTICGMRRFSLLSNLTCSSRLAQCALSCPSWFCSGFAFVSCWRAGHQSDFETAGSAAISAQGARTSCGCHSGGHGELSAASRCTQLEQ